jgi:pyruvate ferredoxin oxidoreductase gamma subunit/2-oxoisovalerate ferredoxin oxidoreductase gamma subunit
MLSVRFHGRGGQGAVIASKLLAHALFREGWEVQAFPSFGAERTGAPVAAFLRADRHPITLHCQVSAPDGVVVLDPLLLRGADVTAGLSKEGWLLVNAPDDADAPGVPPGIRLFTCDATRMALAHGLGSRTRPIVNTAMVGALAACTGLVSLDSVLAAIPELVPTDVDANCAAATAAFHASRARTPLSLCSPVEVAVAKK